MGLYYQLWFDNIGPLEVCEFICHPPRRLGCPVIALLDDANTHKGEPPRELQCRHPRLAIEYFPSHVPELNPDEGVW